MYDYARKGDWVQVYQIVLKPEERPDHLPEETRNVPLELWVKGFINCNGKLNDRVEITTITGRIVTGTLVAINPGYIHDFGKCIPELLHIGPQLKGMLTGGVEHE